MGGSATTSNTAGSNDNKNDHNKRQNNLQKNINKLKSKGATKESIAALEAKKAREAKEFKQNTQGIKDGARYVADKLGLVEKKAGPFDYLQKGKTTGMYASKYAGTKDADFYGVEADEATNDYLVSIGEAKKNPSGSYLLTAQGWKMKYGSYAPGGPQNPSAMGSGDPRGIITSTAISGPMFERQKKTKSLILGGLALVGMPVAGTFFAHNNRPSNTYSNYLNKFYSTMSSSGIKSSQKINSSKSTSDNVVSNQNQVVDPNTEEKEISTTTNFKKKKASNVSDQIASSRSLFKKTDQTITGSMV